MRKLSVRFSLLFYLGLVFLISGYLSAAPRIKAKTKTVRTGKQQRVDSPLVQVPRFITPPTIDGKINDKEWSTGASFTGMVNWGAEGKPGDPATMVPPLQQVYWYVGYDDKYFYLAMRSPHPKGTSLKANVKENDKWFPILFEDHTEIQFQTKGSRVVKPESGGFYKIMVNPRGVFSDQWYHNGTPGTEDGWTSGAKVKCSVSETSWEMEIAFPFQPLNPTLPIENTKWVTQLLRADHCSGIYFAGWVGESWYGWKNFGELEFKSQAPGFHLNKIGDLLKGELDLQLDLIGKRPEEKITVSAKVINAEGKEIFKQTKSSTLSKGKTANFSIKKSGIPISPEKGSDKQWRQNLVNISVTSSYQSKKGTVKEVIYFAQIPVIKMTERRWEKMIKPWLERRAQTADFGFDIANYPYLNQFETWIDLDLFGVPKEIQSAKKFTLTITDEKDKVLKKANGVINNLLGNLRFALPDLPDGNYQAAVELLDSNGEKVGSAKIAFERKHWPWEHNNIGKADIIFPPFTPIVKENDHTLKVWNRQYVIGKSGLPEKIIIGTDQQRRGWRFMPKPTDILGGNPISLELRSNNKTHKLIGEKVSGLTATQTKAKFTGSGKVGSLAVDVSGHFEFDGWYLVEMTISPNGRTKVDALDMLWKVPEADTIAVHRLDKVRDSFYGPFPKGEGVVWKSTQLNPCRGLIGTWAPAVFIGTGERGLWYLAESDQGWLTDDEISCIQAERIDGIPTIRFRLINKKSVIEKPRKITFAIIATPVKPLPDHRGIMQFHRKIAWGWPEGYYYHSTTGMRYFGNSVDGPELYTEQDYINLRNYLMGFSPAPEKVHPGVSRPWLSKGKPLVLYGSARMCGVSKEFKSFAGEWLGRTNYKKLTKPWNSLRNMRSWAGVEWKTQDQVSPAGVSHTDSYLDYYLYYLKNLVEKVHISGTWWDNQSMRFGGPLATGKSYIRDDGKIQGKSSIFAWREQTKRLNVMGWQSGFPPLYLQNMNPLCSFTQIGWHIENSFHLFQHHYPANEFGENSPVEVFRALVLSKQGIIHRLAYFNRSLLGLCLLHDVGNTGPPQWAMPGYHLKHRILQIMEDNVLFFSGTPEFVPYWRQKIIKLETPDVYCSVFIHRPRPPHRRGRWPAMPPKALVVMFNDGEERIAEGFEINNPKFLGMKAVTKVSDPETGAVFGLVNDKKLRKRRYGDMGPGKIKLHKHDFRLLLIE